MIYDLADLRVSLNNKYAFTRKFCSDYLSADQVGPADISAEATEDDLKKERALSPMYPMGYIENICLFRNACRRFPKFERFLLHASIVEYENEGYAFLGTSGTGKSTHSSLWVRYISAAKILNGDKPIVRFDSDRFYAYGTPWSGKEHWGQKGKCVLKALCFLEQAKENSIRKLDTKEISERLLKQIFMPSEKEEIVATLDLADKLIYSVPAYLLSCNISEEAVKTSFEKMTCKSYEQAKRE